MPGTFAERLRALLADYDVTVATPYQAQDIAEADLLHAVEELTAQTVKEWRG